MMNPVDEDVVPAEVEVRKNSDKPAADLDNIVLRKNRCKDGKKEQRRMSVDFSEDVETIPMPSILDLSLIDVTDEGKNKESENSGCTDTLEKDTKVQKKFTYHQDSMKRYKKQQNSKNAEVLERKISEECSPCVL